MPKYIMHSVFGYLDIFLLITAIHEIWTVQGTDTGNHATLVSSGQLCSQHVAHVLIVQDLVLGSAEVVHGWIR